MELPEALGCLTTAESQTFRAVFGDPPSAKRPPLSDAAAILMRHVEGSPVLYPLVEVLMRGEPARAEALGAIYGMDSAIMRGQLWADELWIATESRLAERVKPWRFWDRIAGMARLWDTIAAKATLAREAAGAWTLAAICVHAAARRWDALRGARGAS